MSIPSPIDQFEASEHLIARVVSLGSRPHLHGYDVQADLATHFDFAELVYTALVGRPPTPHQGLAFNLLLSFLAPATVAEAPVHGAVLARLCGALTRRVSAAAAVGLYEQAGSELEGHAALLEWLDGAREDAPPSCCVPIDDADREAASRLAQGLRGCGVEVSIPLGEWSLRSALVAGLFACGLTEHWQLEVAWCLARMPVAAAEAMAARAGAMRDYPIRLPQYRYDPRRRDDRG